MGTVSIKNPSASLMGAIKESYDEKNQPKKRSLHDLVEEYREFLWHIEDNDGVIEEAWFKQLDQLDVAFTEKVDRCLWVAEEFEAQAEQYKRRADALAQHAKALKARGKRLKDNVKLSMDKLGLKKLSTETYPAVRIQKSNPTLFVLDERSFVRDYVGTDLVRTEHKIEKRETLALLKEQIKDGEQRLKHVELIDDRTHLRYK